MGTGIYFTIEAYVYIFLLIVVYFNKKNFKNIENHVYEILIFITFLELTVEIILDFVGPLYLTIPKISYFFAKLYCLLLIIWNCHICMYVIIISLKMKEKDKYIKYVRPLLLATCTIFLVLCTILPIKFLYRTNIAYTYGKSVNTVYLSGVFYIVLGTIFFLWNYKKIKDRRFIPMIVLITFGSICSFIQFKNPELLLTTSVHTFITFLMYFTIENPDLIMIEELTKAKTISEKTNDEKSKFLFEVTNDIEDKLDKVNNLYSEMNSLNPSKEMQNDLTKLKNIIDISRVTIKKTIDVSEIDARKLKILNNKYNPSLIINEVYTKYKKDINSNIDFRLNLSSTMPKELYGDSEKIKQIISTLICNSIKYTKRGFIEIRINSIIKYDVCRLIISVEDSGIGMDLNVQNEILSNHEDLNSNEENIIDNSQLNLKIVRKLVNLIGGSFIIESNYNEGTKVKVILDQKLVNENKTNEEQKIDAYSNDIKNKTKIAIISLNKEEIKTIKQAIIIDSKIDEYVQTLDCLNKIRNNNQYDYIFIDENMEKINANNFLSKCRVIRGFKGKIIVITGNNDIIYRKQLLDNGFNGIITTKANKDEIREILKAIIK